MKTRTRPSGPEGLEQAFGQSSSYGASLASARSERWHRIDLTLRTITPLYGGGVEAGAPDMLLPLRPRAIKNAIANWWWLRNRNILGSDDEVFSEYVATFGAAHAGEAAQAESGLKVVSISVTPQSVKYGYFAPYRVGNRGLALLTDNPTVSDLTYALFPARGIPVEGATQSPADVMNLANWVSQRIGNDGLVTGDQSERSPVLTDQLQATIRRLFSKQASGVETFDPPRCLIRAGLEASLSLLVDRTLTERRRERLYDAIALWANFGGLGARTSRGLGSFHVGGPGAPAVRVARSRGEALSVVSQGQSTPPKGWAIPLYTPMANATRSAEQSWRRTLRDFRDFRQARVSKGQAERPGQSYFPDADTVRMVQSVRGAKHVASHPGATTHGRWLTKLFFGAPVVMPFGSAEGNPDVELRYADSEGALGRFPSPVRIRPILFLDEAGELRAQTAVLRLPHIVDISSKSAAISWKDGRTTRTATLKPTEWKPAFWRQGDSNTSPQLDSVFSAGKLQQLHPPRSIGDPPAMNVEGSVSGSWTPIEMLINYLLRTHRYER